MLDRRYICFAIKSKLKSVCSEICNCSDDFFDIASSNEFRNISKTFDQTIDISITFELSFLRCLKNDVKNICFDLFFVNENIKNWDTIFWNFWNFAKIRRYFWIFFKKSLIILRTKSLSTIQSIEKEKLLTSTFFKIALICRSSDLIVIDLKWVLFIKLSVFRRFSKNPIEIFFWYTNNWNAVVQRLFDKIVRIEMINWIAN